MRSRQPHFVDLALVNATSPTKKAMIGQLRSLKTTLKIFPSKGDTLLDFNPD